MKYNVEITLKVNYEIEADNVYDAEDVALEYFSISDAEVAYTDVTEVAM